MKLLNTALFQALLNSVALVVCAAEPDPLVQVVGGQIKGRLIPDGGAAFKGVPFAQPPVGDLRWREPAPVKDWTGVRDAGAFGPACTQQNRQQQTSQEDCLYLNLWTPDWPPKSPKPVMVWLHGGGNAMGRASVGYLDGTSLSRRGVILVTINYRLGVFGFLVHPGLTAESPHHSSGNYGLLDQLAVLKWVRENIAKFGGDPGNVTLFGQSAGAIDTSILVASPLSKGLIHRSIQESGPPLRQLGPVAQEEKVGVKFAESLKAPAGAAEAVKFLRSVSTADLQKASEAAKLRPDGVLARPVIDGWVMPRYPAYSYQDGQELPIPMIVGSNAREQAWIYKLEEMKQVIADNFGSLAPKAEEFYGLNKSALGNDDPLLGPASTQLTADTRHRCGAVAEAIWRSSHGRTTYEYQFDPPIAGEPATKHEAEIPFVFGNLLPSGPLSGPFGEADKKISADIQQYWVNFAKTGNPNSNGLPTWSKFDPKARPYLEFTLHDGPLLREGLRRDVCDMFIEALKETIPSGSVAFKLGL